MVRGLVHQQRARIFFQPVPPAEIVGAVVGVQIFVKVHRNNVTKGLLQQKLLYLLGFWIVTSIEGDGDLLTRLLLSIQDRCALLLVGAEWLFTHHIAAQLERPNDVTRVSSIHCCYHDRVRANLFDHSIEIGEGRCVGPNQVLGRLDTLPVDVA